MTHQPLEEKEVVELQGYFHHMFSFFPSSDVCSSLQFSKFTTGPFNEMNSFLPGKSPGGGNTLNMLFR